MLPEGLASLLPFFAIVVVAPWRVGAIKCSQVKRKTQHFPEIQILEGASGLSFFTTSHGENVALNELIPPRCDEAVRVVLYNTHRLLDLYGKEDVASVKADLLALDASIVVFHDLPPLDAAPRITLETWLMSEDKFKYRLFKSPQHDSMMIASMIDASLINDIRGVTLQTMAIRVEYSQFHFNVISLWMTAPVDADAPVPPAEAIRGRVLLQSVDRGAPLPILVDESMHYDMLVTNVFSSLMRPMPRYTSWTGLVTDSVGTLGRLGDRLCSAYVYFTETSGRLPLVVDLGQCQIQAPWWLYAATASIILVAIAAHFFFRSLKSRA